MTPLTRPAALAFYALAMSLHATPPKVACIGDSITAGTFLNYPALQSYPGKLAQILGSDFEVRNFGVSGTTLLQKGDFPYWKDPAFAQSHAWNPDIVTIMLGTNDSKPNNWKYGTNFISDYEAMIASYTNLSSHPRILVCLPCPVYGNGDFNIVPGVVATNVVPKVMQVAVDLDLQIIDVNLPMMGHRDWFYDNVHPNSKGTSVMAALVRTALVGQTDGGLAPALTLSFDSAGHPIAKWPSNWASWVLQSTAIFNSRPPAWAVVDFIATNDGGGVRITNTAPGLSHYYRLWNPAL